MSHIASRSGAVALTSAALMGLSALTLPAVAGAADAADTCAPADATYAVEGGTIEWGFKQSFRSYFFGGFAHGAFTPSEGVSFAGNQTGADGRIVWPVASGTVDSATAATASGSGDANFNAHGGAMNTTMSNPTVEIAGTNGVLKIDYEGNAFTSMDPNAPAEPISGTQVVAATFDLSSAPDLHTGGQVTLTSGASLIGDDFVPAFSSYPSGSELDPVKVVLDITSICDSGEPGEPGDGGDNGEGGDGGTLPGDDDNTGGGIFGSLSNILGIFGL